MAFHSSISNYLLRTEWNRAVVPPAMEWKSDGLGKPKPNLKPQVSSLKPQTSSLTTTVEQSLSPFP